MRRQSWWVIPLVSVLSACGPKAGSDDDGGSSSTSAGDDTTGAATSGSVSTSLSDTSGSTGADACSEFVSTREIGPSLTLRVRNDGDAPVWVVPVGCGGAVPFEILGLAGQTVRWHYGECFPERCDDFFGATDCYLGCPDCAPPSVAQLGPAATAQSTWSGVSLTPLQMTPECAPGEECQRECLREDQAPSGEYTLQLTVYTACTGTCDCDNPNPDGLCPMWELAELSDPMELAVPFSYPDAAEVEVAIP